MTITELRKAKGMTQRDLARAIGANPVSVSKWESGRMKPKGETLEKLSKVLECAPEDITPPVRAAQKKAGELASLIPPDWWEKHSTALIGETVELLKIAYDAGYADGSGTP